MLPRVKSEGKIGWSSDAIDTIRMYGVEFRILYIGGMCRADIARAKLLHLLYCSTTVVRTVRWRWANR